ncbi:deoxyribose-phosphate aldolase [Martelella mediterranea]|uniref:Deoxyribose-phosphate aldolase n=1 Tax=Martelella mediterranea TaxID=293089 RepID=A0A4R3NU53_9HYPH|nr:deoxyribose-phosphate aldolase [Martelella mediterranea]TCT41125.1 deoxyribose-phosphate aldolase [Martelella mediterranea]
MKHHSLQEAASVSLSLLDLTNLKDDCNERDVEDLLARAHTPYGTPAAICIWPRFVSLARQILGDDHLIRIATVVNFPSGDLSLSTVEEETEQAIRDGADEIDLVIPYKKLKAGNEWAVSEMIRAIRFLCREPVTLKVILETGELADAGLIRKAARLAIDEGADFIKTSTGKVSVNATLEAADIMLGVIREAERPVGFKPAGGVSSVQDAQLYLSLAETVMGEGWVTPATFRFGASGLLNDIEGVLAGKQSAVSGDSY